MTQPINIAEINALSIPERIVLIEEIWGSITAEPDGIPLTQDQRDEFERRIVSRKHSPNVGASGKAAMNHASGTGEVVRRKFFRNKRAPIGAMLITLAVIAGFLVVGYAKKNTSRYSINDALSVHLRAPTATASQKAAVAGFPMNVLVTQVAPDVISFEGNERISISDGRVWTRQIRGKIPSADIHPGGVIFSNDVFALYYNATQPDER